MTDFKAKMHQIRISAGAPPQTPLRELTALPQTPLLDWKGRGWVGEEEGKVEGNGREGEVQGGKGRAPKLLLNQGPSETCYATVSLLLKY